MSTSNAKDNFLISFCSHRVGWDGPGHLCPYLSGGTKSSQIWAFKLPALRWWMNAKSHNCNLLVGPRDDTTMKICNAMINSCARHSRVKTAQMTSQTKQTPMFTRVLRHIGVCSPPPLSLPHTKESFKVDISKYSLNKCFYVQDYMFEVKH